MKQIHKLLSTAALLCWASIALAGEPITGVDVKLNKNPGGSVANVKSDANGNYQFSKLAQGKYELCIARQACKTVVVGPEGMLTGRVQKNMDKGVSGAAKNMYNGDVTITTDAEAARKNHPASKGVGEPAKATTVDRNRTPSKFPPGSAK